MSGHVNAQMTVGEVAANYPGAVRTLEALGLDYCCGGKEPLAQAAAGRGLPVDTVIAVLDAAIAQATSASEDAQWLDAPLDELLAHIVDTHHTFMNRELPRLEAMMALVARVHGPNHGGILYPLAETYAALKAELTAHLTKEETITFPAIERLLDGQYDEVIHRTVHELEDEHQVAGAALAKMHEITNDFAIPDGVCNTYRALYDGLREMELDIHQHIHLENNVLFPRVRALIRECTRAA
ncbi:MAG: iron-sulfur cluster repair di-iron protein [Armatimonadota bacterium]